MNKLYDRIYWHNNTTPALNESNLNSMSKGIDDIDDRVVELAGTIMETIPQLEEDISEAEGLIDRLEDLTENPPYIGANGDWYVWDTNTGAYVDSGVDASITVTIADITMLAPNATPYVTNTGTDTDPIFHLYIPKGVGISSIAKTGTSGLVDTYTITYSDNTTTTFTVTNGKSAYQYATEAGYTGTESDFYDDMANTSVYASDSEAYAIGKRGGTDVSSSDPAYHNNSKYYSEQALSSANSASSSASDASSSASTAVSAKDAISTMLAIPTFTVDFTTGELIYTNDATYSFAINYTTGNLEWEVVA